MTPGAARDPAGRPARPLTEHLRPQAAVISGREPTASNSCTNGHRRVGSHRRRPDSRNLPVDIPTPSRMNSAPSSRRKW